MATTKITFSIDDKFGEYIRKLAKENNKPISRMVVDIIKEWIEIKNKKSEGEKLFNIVNNNPLSSQDKQELYKELDNIRENWR